MTCATPLVIALFGVSNIFNVLEVDMQVCIVQKLYNLQGFYMILIRLKIINSQVIFKQTYFLIRCVVVIFTLASSIKLS